MVSYPLPPAATFAAPVTVAGPVTKQAVLTGLTLPASGQNALGAGQIYEACAWGILSTALAADTFTLELDYGSTDLMDWGAQQPNSGGVSTNVRFLLEFTVEMMSATLARASGWNGLSFFFSSLTSRESTIAAGTAASWSLAVTPSSAADSITFEGGYIRRVA